MNIFNWFKKKSIKSVFYKIQCYCCDTTFVQQIDIITGTESEETTVSFPCPKCVEYNEFKINGKPKL